MIISTSGRDEHADPNKAPGGYEWWYLDGLSSDGEWGFVIIFYHGNPFSPAYIREESGNDPRDYPALSVSLYRKGKTEFYSFQEFNRDDFSSAESPFSIRIGNNRLDLTESNGELHYTVELDITLSSGHHLKGNLSMHGKTVEFPLDKLAKGEDLHTWNLLLPAAQYTAEFELNGRTTIETIAFEGMGYHDHNTGNEPMKDSFRDWYWGRYHTRKYTFLYYVMNGHTRRQYKGWLIDNEKNTVHSRFDDATISDYRRSILGLRPASSLIFSDGNTVVNVRQESPVDSGPFYQRYFSSMILRTRDEVAAATGISEYIVPERIYNKRFWWMIHMRLRYMKREPHWVQRFRKLYERTW